MTPTQEKVHKLLQLAMECETHHVGVSYSSATKSLYMSIYEFPYEGGAEIIHSDHTYVDNMLGDADTKLDEMIAYVEALS